MIEGQAYVAEIVSPIMNGGNEKAHHPDICSQTLHSMRQEASDKLETLLFTKSGTLQAHEAGFQVNAIMTNGLEPVGFIAYFNN